MKVIIVDEQEQPIDIVQAFNDLEAAVASIEGNGEGGTGDVIGPGSSVDLRVAVFDGITGKLLKDGGKTISQVSSYFELISQSALKTKADNNQIEINKTYLTTGCNGNSATLYLRGKDISSVYSPFDYGIFANANMQNPVEGTGDYDLDSDSILLFRDPLKDNMISGPAVNTFPFDTAGNGCKLKGVALTWDHNSIIEAVIAENCIINIGKNSTCSLIGGKYHTGCELHLVDDHNFTNCELGAGKLIDLANMPAGYSPNGRIYNDNGSTFDYGTLGLAGQTVIDLTNIDGNGADISFCGFIKISNSDSAAALIDDISSLKTDHKIIFEFLLDVGYVSFRQNHNIYPSGGIQYNCTQTGQRFSVSYSFEAAGWIQNGDSFQ